MTRAGAVAAAALVLAVNGLVLARVARNRAGAADATLTLTERELPVSASPRETESSAVTLRFDVARAFWARPEEPDLDVTRWLDVAKLGELGFDLRLPASVEESARFLRRQGARTAYAVLELEGPAWRRYRAALERMRDRPPERGEEVPSWQTEAIARELRSGTRLFVVDAGLDPAALRQRYPDRGVHLLLPAEVRAYLDRDPGVVECRPASCRARGTLTLLIDEVLVPRRLHPAIAPVVRADQASSQAPDHDPRYQVTLRSGARHEPWIEAIQPLRAGPR